MCILNHVCIQAYCITNIGCLVKFLISCFLLTVFCYGIQFKKISASRVDQNQMVPVDFVLLLVVLTNHWTAWYKQNVCEAGGLRA